MSEQQSAPVVEAQRFPAGLFINQPTNHLNTIETSNTPIWWDICQGGSGNQYCYSTYALDVMDEGKFRSDRYQSIGTCWLWWQIHGGRKPCGINTVVSTQQIKKKKNVTDVGTNLTAHAPGPLIRENIRICFTFAIKLLVKLQHNQIYQRVSTENKLCICISNLRA